MQCTIASSCKYNYIQYLYWLTTANADSMSVEDINNRKSALAMLTDYTVNKLKAAVGVGFGM